MKHSESLNELAAALAKAQATMGSAKRDSANPFFKSSYADLASIRDACNKALTDQGLSVAQWPRLVAAGESQWIVEVETALLHASGQWMRDTLAVPVSKPDAQGVGSAITYARRYALSAVVGVAPDDDDGNAAAGRSDHEKPVAARANRPDVPPAEGTARRTMVTDVRQRTGTNEATGKDWVKFTIKTADGGEFSTFDKKHAEVAKSALKAATEVVITSKASKFGVDLLTIVHVDVLADEEPPFLMLTSYLVLDVASAPIDGAARYLEGSTTAPAHYKDVDKIAAYVAQKEAERLTMAAVDVDLARITAIGVCVADVVSVYDAHTEDEERALLAVVAGKIDACEAVLTYGGHNFDLPLLMRRARYLGVDFPTLNLDRYRSPHVDLCELLSDRNPSRRRPLGFYTKRLGWTDISKPLSGADEARVFETGQWEELVASVYHDVAACRRLAGWLGLIADHVPIIEEPVL